MKKISFKKGFTLIEVVLYLAISVIIITSITSITTVTFEFKAKTQAISEVEQVSNQILLLIGRTIRSSTNVTTPTQGNTAGSLVLSGTNATFSLSGNNIFIQEGANPSIQLNSNTIVISNLTFTNSSKTGTNTIFTTLSQHLIII